MNIHPAIDVLVTSLHVLIVKSKIIYQYKVAKHYFFGKYINAERNACVMKLYTILAINRKHRQKQIRKIREWKGLFDYFAAGNRYSKTIKTCAKSVNHLFH